MCEADSVDERLCIYCFKVKEDLESLLLGEKKLCLQCQSQLREWKKSYRVQGILIHVLYVYDDFLQGLFFQYKEQRDVVLKDVFLESQSFLHKKLRKYTVCGMCSSDEKRLFRGFEPLKEIFSTIDIFVYSPLYKVSNVKQSSRSKKERSHIEEEIFLKDVVIPYKRPLCLVDDVLTTGATISRGIALLHPDCVFVLSAHPLWLQEHQKDQVRSSFFR